MSPKGASKYFRGCPEKKQWRICAVREGWGGVRKAQNDCHSILIGDLFVAKWRHEKFWGLPRKKSAAQRNMEKPILDKNGALISVWDVVWGMNLFERMQKERTGV